MIDNRIAELLELARAEGLTLPYPLGTLCALEDTGAVVDLRTGAILLGEADTPYRWEPTPAGEILAAALAQRAGG